MTFTATQTAQLAADLDRKHVAQRSQAGRQLSYIEGWHALAEANRIFGFAGWSSETVAMQLVSEGERTSKFGKKLMTCTYTARCRVTVYAGDRVIVREGVGAGHGMDEDAGQAHEKAIKEAETDSRKRALMTFGNQFGLALYDKTQANVSDGADDDQSERRGVAVAAAPATPAKAPPEPRAENDRPAARAPMKAPTARDSDSIRKLILLALDFCTDMESLTAWGKNNGRQAEKWSLMLPIDQRLVLKAAGDKLKAVKAAQAGADPVTGEVAA